MDAWSPCSGSSLKPRFQRSTSLQPSRLGLNYAVNGLSPITDLALNLDCLTTNNTVTPKRRISWSTETPPLEHLQKFLTYDSASPCLNSDSPTFDSRLFRDVTLEKEQETNQKVASSESGAGFSISPISSTSTTLVALASHTSAGRSACFACIANPGTSCCNSCGIGGSTSLLHHGAAPAFNVKGPTTQLSFPRSNLRRIRSLPTRALSHKPNEKENVPACLFQTDHTTDDLSHLFDTEYSSSSSSSSPTGTRGGSSESGSSRIRTYGQRLVTGLGGRGGGSSDWDSDSQDSGCILSSQEERSSSTSSSELELILSSEGKTSKASFNETVILTSRRKTVENFPEETEGSDYSEQCSILVRKCSNQSSVMADNEEEDDEEFEDGFDVFNELNQNVDENDRRLTGLFTQPISQAFLLRKKNAIATATASATVPSIVHSPNSPQALSRVPVRRSLSMLASLEYSPNSFQTSGKEDQENHQNGCLNVLNRKRLLTPEDATTILAFKRPEDPPEDSIIASSASPCFLLETKRRKSVSVALLLAQRRPSDSQLLTAAAASNSDSSKRCLTQRSYSSSDIRIDSALLRSEQERNLIGDYTGCNSLPILEGRHPDLKTISVETLRRLINGGFKDEIECFTIVDCRYPYEFEGGHIQGAQNVYSKQSIIQKFLVENDCSEEPNNEIGLQLKLGSEPNNMLPSESTNSRTLSLKEKLTTVMHRRSKVLIFHCEFSSERGPKLYRFLRKEDRQVNKDNYPFLFYPEIYLLDGGYKEFYSQNKELCEPQMYKPMAHKDHRQDLTHFRAKSKSWNGNGSKVRVAFRSGLKL